MGQTRASRQNSLSALLTMISKMASAPVQFPSRHLATGNNHKLFLQTSLQICVNLLLDLLFSCVMRPLCIYRYSGSPHLYLLLPERCEAACGGPGSAGGGDGSIYWLISRLAFTVIHAN